MDVAGALLPFTHIARPELTIHVQEVLTQADRAEAKVIPRINEPNDIAESEKVKSPVKSPVKVSKDSVVRVNGKKPA